VEGELAEAAQEALDLLFELTDIEAEADFFLDEERLEVELWGPDDHLLLQEDGQILLAIEHLLPRMLRGLHGETMPVRVDCNDFHFLREERLRELALRTAGEVRQRGRPRTLDELDPAERRIVHLTLADDPDVTTDSIGDGYYKRLKIVPRMGDG
jgi:spoIIIJ-associated protein